MSEHRALLISMNYTFWNDIHERFLHVCGFQQVYVADTLQQALNFLKEGNAFDLVLFCAHNWHSYSTPLEVIRRLRIEGYLGALIVYNASVHSLLRLAESYPLAELVDVVFDGTHPLELAIIDEALLRARERKLGIHERDAIWMTSPSVSGPGAIGFQIWER